MNTTLARFLAKHDIENPIWREHAAALGRILRLRSVVGCWNGLVNALDLPRPMEFRVAPTGYSNLVRWSGEWCDPTWNLEPVDPALPEFEGWDSFFCLAPNYRSNGMRGPVHRVFVGQ